MRAVLVLIALGLLATGAFQTISNTGDADATQTSAVGAAECGAAAFDRYDAGPAVNGLAKHETVRRCEPDVGAPTRINMVAALYGSCEPTGSDSGCAPPVQVQSWPACERNLALYEQFPGPDGEPIEYTKTSIRGVPAAIFEEGRRIELYTGDATIVVFAENQGLARAAVNRLNGVHGGKIVRSTEQLPAPAGGALAGKLAC